jgi:hypothetical protein
MGLHQAHPRRDDRLSGLLGKYSFALASASFFAFQLLTSYSVTEPFCVVTQHCGKHFFLLSVALPFELQ